MNSNILRLIIGLLSILLSSTATAYNTEDSFDYNERNVKLMGGHEKMADWSFTLGGVPRTINTPAIRLGTRDEDYGNSPLMHFYNPATGKGLPGFQNAKERAVDWYEKAIKTASPGKFMGNLWFGQVSKCVI